MQSRWSRWAMSLAVGMMMVLGAGHARAEDDDDGGGGGDGAGHAAEPAAAEPAAAEPAGDHADDKPAAGSADADDDHAGSAAGSADADDDHAGSGSAGGAAPLVADDAADVADGNAENAFEDPPPAEGEMIDVDGDGEADVAYFEYDEDGDGVVEPDEAAAQQEFMAAYGDVPSDINDDALDARPDASALLPSMDIETFRKLVRLAKQKVMPRLEAGIEKKTAAKMMKFTKLVMLFSLAGLLLLFAPLFLLKKYPGKGGMLFKYAAIAAATFIVTVNLFGVVLLGLRTAQGALSKYTNPQLAVASGLFNTLDNDAEEYIVLGKELFAPTLKQMQSNSDEPPAAAMIANGQRVVKDAQVFLSIAKVFKKLDVLFGLLPIVLTALTLVLFIVALKPTLMAIIELPGAMASGKIAGGTDVVKASLKRVYTEFLATLATLGGLLVVTLIGAFILGQIVEPALKSLLEYFCITVQYLQFVEGASSGVVFLALIGVTFFLGLNLAAVILSSAFFLGKLQKVFQNKFTDGVPLSTHKRFFTWGPIALLWVMAFPLLFLIIGQRVLAMINDKMMDGVVDPSQINWKMLLLAGPLVLVIGFIVMFWAVRGLKALVFLFKYQVKPKAPKAAAAG